MANTVKLKKYLDVNMEFVAVNAILPGMLVEITSANKVQRHATSGGDAVPLFALEDELQGKGIDEAYAADDPVQVWVAQRGEVVQALLADGETAVIGSFLVSNGDGYLRVQSQDSVYGMDVVGVALEAIDRASSSGADTNVTGQIKVMVA